MIVNSKPYLIPNLDILSSLFHGLRMKTMFMVIQMVSSNGAVIIEY